MDIVFVHTPVPTRDVPGRSQYWLAVLEGLRRQVDWQFLRGRSASKPSRRAAHAAWVPPGRTGPQSGPSPYRSPRATAPGSRLWPAATARSLLVVTNEHDQPVAVPHPAPPSRKITKSGCGTRLIRALFGIAVEIFATRCIVADSWMS